MKRSKPFRVALLVESSRGYGRGLLVGIARYIREVEPWIVSRLEHKLEDEIPGWFRSWNGDGVITRLDNPDLDTLLRRKGVPVVYLRTPAPRIKAPSVLLNDQSVVAAGFEHLRERGFRHFAFCGLNGADYSDIRRAAFVRLVCDGGFRCHIFKSAHRPKFNTVVGYERYGLLEEDEEIRTWIKNLPKPVGVMTCNDLRGERVLAACRAIQVAVPDELAVIGVDNDEVLCDFSHPPLSSVIPNTRRTGYEAAALLHRMMLGKKVPPRTVWIEPAGVATRQSTEVLAIEDRHIAAAARFIREHACQSTGVSVKDVARAAALSERSLERRFIKILGHTPKEEILRVRLNRAKQLLTETDLPLSVIGEKIGLEHTEYISRIFKKKVGMTPGAFRKKAQTTDAANRRRV